ncbi:MAG TPA: DUF4349 domain-containing protein [Anaerolineaceae bacterium]|nr:DUF4349 domain-containing protein [Anaerolineaceae bacterium]
MNKRLIILALMLVAVIFSACQGAPQTANESVMPDLASDGRGASEWEVPAEAPAAEPQAEEGKGYDSGAPQGAPPAASIERMVIRNAEMAIIVDDPAVALDEIVRMASEMEGYVVNSTLYQVYNSQGVQVPEGTISVRVPADRLDAAIERIIGLTQNPAEDVTRNNTYGQDVTQEYTDLSSRLKNLEEAEAQLRKIMEEAYQTEDVLSVFNELTRIREQIEVIKGQMQYYEQASALSAISVSIKARQSVAPITVAGWTPVGVARDAVQALLEAGQFLASAAIWLVLFVLPVVLLIAIPVALVALLVRRLVRNRRPAAPPTPAE